MPDVPDLSPVAPPLDAESIFDAALTDPTSCPQFDPYIHNLISPLQAIYNVIYERTHDGAEDAFYVADMGELKRQYRRWTTHLPRVRPYYAIKCNDNPVVLAKLASLGVGFDCASQKEIDTVLSLGVPATDIIFANPCKPASHIRHACDHGVHRMTVDNADEILKISQINANAKIVLRILVNDSSSICRFGVKFGMTLATAKRLMLLARELRMSIIGVSFHVGSGCTDASAFAEAVRSAKVLFDLAPSYGFCFSLLDIGGGFPGANSSGPITFEKIAATVGPAIDELFDASVNVIAEPGRYFVASAFTLSVRVNSRRVVTRTIKEIDDVPSNYMYYVNDGVYGSFNCLIFDHAVLSTPYVIHLSKPASEPEALYESSIWGPTCDSIDCLTRKMMLPPLEIGDWMTFSNMGAYTMAAASTFNGFPKSLIVYIDTEQPN